jgi:hypothetical protein
MRSSSVANESEQVNSDSRWKWQLSDTSPDLIIYVTGTQNERVMEMGSECDRVSGRSSERKREREGESVRFGGDLQFEDIEAPEAHKAQRVQVVEQGGRR